MDMLSLFMILLGIASLPGVHRLLIGPTMTDRVIGLDMLFAVAIVFCMLAAWASGRTVFLDVAIGIALSGFIATIAWARLIEVHSTHEAERGIR